MFGFLRLLVGENWRFANFNDDINNSALYSFAVKSLLAEQLQPDDTLTIVCDIIEEPTRRTLSMTDRMWMKNGNPMMLLNSVYHKELVKDMNNIFMNKDNGHDVLVNCGDQVFYCHKEKVI